MSREEAINILEEVKELDDSIYQYNTTYLKALEMAIQALEQTQWIPCSERLPKHYDSHDLIHRETARRIIDSPRTKEQMLMVLASAENQKKTGHWVYEPRKRLINETDEGCEYITEYWCKCSECGGDFGFQKMSDAYCKYCGAKMEV